MDMNTTIDISSSTFLVTGANRGIGKATVEALLAKGAKKVYAAARKPDSLQDLLAAHGDRVEAVQLDVTKPDDIASAAQQVGELDVLINNAGVATFTPLLEDGAVEDGRKQFEVNVFGLGNVTNAFLPHLKKSKAAAIVNLDSVASLINFPPLPWYSATKAAAESLTQAYRAYLSADQILVVGVYPGPIDTDMAEQLPLDKVGPDVVANEILAALENGTEDVFPDPFAKEFAKNFAADPKGVEAQNAGMLQQPA